MPGQKCRLCCLLGGYSQAGNEKITVLLWFLIDLGQWKSPNLDKGPLLHTLENELILKQGHGIPNGYTHLSENKKFTSVHWQMNKQNVVYTFSEILLSLNSEIAVTCYNMDEPWGHCAKWNEAFTKKTNTVWFHLDELPREVKLIETESRMVVARGRRRGRGKWEPSFNSLQSFSFARWKSSGDGCWTWLHNSVNVLNTPELYTKYWFKW